MCTGYDKCKINYMWQLNFMAQNPQQSWREIIVYALTLTLWLKVKNKKVNQNW